VAWGHDGATIAWGNASDPNAVGVNARGPLERTFRLEGLEFGAAPDAACRRAQASQGSLALERSGPTSLMIKRSGVAIATLTMPRPFENIACYTLLAGDHAAVGTRYGLRLINTRSGTFIREFSGHTGIVYAVAPSPDGRLLLSGSSDQTIRVWDPERDEPLL